MIKIIEDLKNNELNLFENKKNECKIYTAYYEKAEKMRKRQRSIFFNQIHKSFKKIGKNDEESLKEIKKNVSKFKCIFEKDGIKKLNSDELLFCLKPFQKKDKNDIINELSVLREIFKINTSKNYSEIQNDLLLILKREYIYNIAI